LLAFAKSDIGLIRERNEDSYTLLLPSLFIVADGMGGHVAGEIASKLAITTMSDYVKEVPESTSPEVMLQQAIIRANKVIYEMGQSKDQCAGMGTTVTAAYVDKDKIYWGHVGDSRLYLLSGDNMYQLTSDHSLVWELMLTGNISPDEARNHPHRNILTRAVGANEDILVDTGVSSWKSGDFLLLCTDGLTNMISEQTIYEIIQSASNGIEQKIEKLINAAKEAGGFDNITVILVQNGE